MIKQAKHLNSFHDIEQIRTLNTIINEPSVALMRMRPMESRMEKNPMEHKLRSL